MSWILSMVGLGGPTMVRVAPEEQTQSRESDTGDWVSDSLELFKRFLPECNFLKNANDLNSRMSKINDDLPREGEVNEECDITFADRAKICNLFKNLEVMQFVNDTVDDQLDTLVADEVFRKHLVLKYPYEGDAPSVDEVIQYSVQVIFASYPGAQNLAGIRSVEEYLANNIICTMPPQHLQNEIDVSRDIGKLPAARQQYFWDERTRIGLEDLFKLTEEQGKELLKMLLDADYIAEGDDNAPVRAVYDEYKKWWSSAAHEVYRVDQSKTLEAYQTEFETSITYGVEAWLDKPKDQQKGDEAAESSVKRPAHGLSGRAQHLFDHILYGTGGLIAVLQKDAVSAE